MLQSLRMRLALSHTLPILIFVPLLGLVLLYQLEQRFFLNYMARELAVQGELIAEFPRTDPRLWTDTAHAADLINALQQQLPAQMAFVDEATLLAVGTHPSAESRSPTAATTEPQLEASLLARAAQGQVVWTIDDARGTADRAINVAVPVFDDAGKVIGAVQLSQRITDIQERINGLRVLVLATLLIGAVLSLLLGLLLARSLGAPLLQLSEVVARFQPTVEPEYVPETGPVEMKMLAASFNHLCRRLHELERTRTLLLSGIVHELGRPLGAMKVAAQTIETNDDLIVGQELAGGINEHIDRLQLQLDDLALLGEIEIRGLILHPECFPIIDIMLDLCRQFQEIALHKEITLTFNATQELPSLYADPRRVEQILSNLLHNACKYTPAGGHIAVTAGLTPTTNGASLWVDVADSGPGISLAEAEQIFHYFYRNPQLRRFHQGMGIGLALARQLAEAHGGTLTVTTPGLPGATFHLVLPVLHPDASASA